MNEKPLNLEKTISCVLSVMLLIYGSRYDRGVVSVCQDLELKDGLPVIQGVVEESQEYICLDRVPIVTPNCDVIVSSLSLKVNNKQVLTCFRPFNS